MGFYEVIRDWPLNGVLLGQENGYVLGYSYGDYLKDISMKS